MAAHDVQSALVAITEALAARPDLEGALRERLAGGAATLDSAAAAMQLEPALRASADVVQVALPQLAREPEGAAQIASWLDGIEGLAVVAWARAVAFRRDLDVAPTLAAAARLEDLHDRALDAARARVVEGPLLDALACAPLLGDGDALPVNAEARARLEILLWEAGASALEVPALGRWIWGSSATFDALVHAPAHGALRGRVLAARCLEISVRGMSPMTDPELIGRTLQVLQPLLLHPEPLGWVHAARALGRLTGVMEALEGTLLDWVFGASQVLRQRATTAFASLPAERLAFLSSQLVAILDSPEEEAWVLAAVAAATPYLFFERRKLWDRLAARVLAGDGGAIAARALARARGDRGAAAWPSRRSIA